MTMSKLKALKANTLLSLNEVQNYLGRGGGELNAEYQE